MLNIYLDLLVIFSLFDAVIYREWLHVVVILY